MFNLPVPYWISIGLVVLALIVLAALVVRLVRAVRAVKALSSSSNAVWRNELGLLRARRAALRVAVGDRRPRPSGNETPAGGHDRM